MAEKEFAFLGVRVDPEDMKRLKETADNRRINVSDLVRMLVFEHLDEWNRPQVVN